MPEEEPQSRIRCTQCGGENELPSGRRILRCAFCDAPLFVDRSRVVSHYRVPPLLGKDEARAALKRWMSGNETVKDLDRKSRIESLAPVSFPMWLFRVAGSDGEEALVEPAAPTPIPQMADVRIPAGALEPFEEEPEGVEVVEVAVPLEAAREWLQQRGAGDPFETALVRVPLWRCGYSFEGVEYQALVDASTGQVLAAVYPEKMETPYYLIAGLGILLFTLEGLMIGNLAAKLLAYLVTGVPLALLAYWVARKV